jgi:hypothetical protein
MRKYTLVFMQQEIGVPHLTPIPGPAGEESFEAMDDDAAHAIVRARFAQRVQGCNRAELSSMAIVTDASGRGTRLVDDSLENPYIQETYIRYDAHTKQLEIDFVSTATGLLSSSHGSASR